MRLVRAMITTVEGRRGTTLFVPDAQIKNGFLYAVHADTGMGVNIRPSDIVETIWEDHDHPKLSGERKIFLQYDPGETSEQRWIAVAVKDGSPCYDAEGRTPEEAMAGLAETLWTHWVDEDQIDGG